MPSRKIEDACSILRAAIPPLIEDYNRQNPFCTAFITCTLRTTEEQQQAWAKGRTIPPIGPGYVVTKLDGIRKLSPHQPQEKHGEDLVSHAVDLGVKIGKVYQQIRFPYYPLMRLALKYGLTSGWDWDGDGDDKDERWTDPPHLQCNVKGPHKAKGVA